MHILVVFENLEYAGLKFIWPAQVELNSGELTHGYSPATLSFSPEEWAEISVNRDGEIELRVPAPQE
jgi:hypothetical protein